MLRGGIVARNSTDSISFTNGHLKKKFKMLYLEDELEFFDHIAPSCSTHEYFKSSEYEALTPSHHGDTEIQYFERTFNSVLLRNPMVSLCVLS